MSSTETVAARDFWTSSGFRLLARDGDGRLAITDDFLRAYFLRPEVAPVEESCAKELALHEALMADKEDFPPGEPAASSRT